MMLDEMIELAQACLEGYYLPGCTVYAPVVGSNEGLMVVSTWDEVSICAWIRPGDGCGNCSGIRMKRS